MKNRLNGLTISILSFCILSGSANIINAEDPVEMQRYLRKSTSFKFETLGKEIPVKAYYITGSTHSRPWNIGSPVIVYVKNHGEERIGQEPDAPILLHYLNQRYIVITIDFENDPRAVSPFFDKDLHELFKAIYANDETSLLGTRLTPRKYRCFFLPAGCRVATDLVFWELDKHGVNGTLEYIMDFYNEHIAGVVTGKEKVTSPDHLTDRQGRPFQYKLAMDIVYPSKAKKRVPLVFYLSTQVTRHPNVAPSVYRPHMMGFTMRGYAYAIVDHCYNPVRRHFWHTPGKFSLDRWNGLACYSAAIRFIRAHAREFNIDDKYIGGMGHSKGQYSIARLSDLQHADKAEARQFEGQPAGSPESQPWPGHSSRISVGYQSPGNLSEFITREYVPTLVSHGEKDKLGRGYRSFFKRLEELDINHITLFMSGLGHELPYGNDEALGINRYDLVHQFFDQYLKVEEKLAPVVLFTVPRDQETDVAPSETISIQFAPVMDEESIVDGRGVKIVGGDGSPVKGSWSKSRRGARFTFNPAEDFREGEKYKAIITTHVKNEVGTHLDEARIAEFTIGKSDVTAETRAAKKPAIVESIILPVPKTFSWDSPLLGKPISCKVYSPGDSSGKKPSVVYLKNLPSPRIGGTADETLISGFLKEGMLVFVADYQHNPKAVAPELLPELDKWYGFLYETETYPVDKDWIYIVPEGYTMDRNVHICELNGRPVGMDVIYPSDPAERVPLMLQVTSTKERGKWINQRAYYIYGLLTTGYAGAIMDWNGTGPGAAPGGDVFPEKRAARLLRARAGDWNLSGRLGVTGHSKGSSRAGKAAFINEGNWEADRGPYAEQSDRFQVALLSAGQHAPEFLIEDGFHKPVRQPSEQLRRISTVTYVTPDDPPVFLSVGALDRPFRVAQMKRLADQCKKVGVEHRVVIQEGMGHMYNPRPQVIGHIFDFFDRYLKPRTQDGHAPVDQRELDRLANQVALTPQSTGDTARSSVEAKSYSGVDAFAIAALESIGAVVEVEGTGSEQFAVKVDLRSGKVTDAELEHVKRLTRLRELRLDGVPVTDDGLKHLQGMASLQRLDLPGAGITDNGLSYLRELKNLRALSIKDNRVTDAGLRHLQGLTQLEMLSLGPNQISDIGVKSLQDLTKLRYLNLTDTQVTDSVFEYLKPLTSLRTLRLRGTRVTEKGVQDMKQMLPDCNVSR